MLASPKCYVACTSPKRGSDTLNFSFCRWLRRTVGLIPGRGWVCSFRQGPPSGEAGVLAGPKTSGPKVRSSARTWIRLRIDIMLRLRMCGTSPSRPFYAFTTCCLDTASFIDRSSRNVAVEWVARLSRVMVGPSSSFGLETGYWRGVPYSLQASCGIAC